MGVWWYGRINPEIFGGVVSGAGSLSLWGFKASLHLPGLTPPVRTYAGFDEVACSILSEQEGPLESPNSA